MGKVTPELEHSLLDEARRLIAVMDDLGKSTPEILATDLPTACDRHLSIAINSTLIDGLVLFSKFNSGLSSAAIEELKNIGDFKTTLITLYEAADDHPVEAIS